MDERSLRSQLSDLLVSKSAHLDLKVALKGLPGRYRGSKPRGAPYSIWQLLEHIRIAQWDILEFSVNSKHVSPKWPEGYWPRASAPPSEAAWRKTIRSVERDLASMKQLVLDPKTDLFAQIPHGKSQTILREALLVADHNAYHVGQIVLLRRMLEAGEKR